MKYILSLFIALLFCSTSFAASPSILVSTKDGKYTAVTSLAAANVAANDGKTVVVTGVLSAVMSNISSASVHRWRPDIELKVEKGGMIGSTTKFTGLKEARPEWFGTNTTPGTTDMTSALNKAIKAAADGGIVTGRETYAVAYNSIELPSNTIIDFNNIGKIVNTADTQGKLFFFAKGKVNITIRNTTFTTPSSYQTAAQFLNCSYVKMVNNTCNNCGLIETGSGLQTSYALGGYYEITPWAIYTGSDGSQLTSHVTIENNVLIGDGTATTLADTRRPAILLTYTTNAMVHHNEIDGYIHGIMWWGGDAAPSANGASGNARKASFLTITGNNINGTTAGGNIWGSMGDSITITGNEGGYSGDVGIDFEGCTNSIATGNLMYNRTNGAIALGFINDNLLIAGNNLITDTTGIYLVNIFGDGTDDNKDISITNNKFTATGAILALIATATTQFNGLTIANNNFTNTVINLPYTHRNLTVSDNKFNFTWDVDPAMTVISASGYENSGVNVTTVNRNVVHAQVALTKVNSGFLSSVGSTFGADSTLVRIWDNDFSAISKAWAITNASDNTANAANLRFDIRRNIISAVTEPVLSFHASGLSTAYREGNQYNNDTFLAYPYYPAITGKWFAGERLLTSPPAAGGYIGKVCTTTGVSGTWKDFGVISP